MTHKMRAANQCHLLHTLDKHHTVSQPTVNQCHTLCNSATRNNTNCCTLKQTTIVYGVVRWCLDYPTASSVWV